MKTNEISKKETAIRWWQDMSKENQLIHANDCLDKNIVTHTAITDYTVREIELVYNELVIKRKAVEWWNTLDYDTEGIVMNDSEVEKFKQTQRFYANKYYIEGVVENGCKNLTIGEVVKIYKQVFHINAKPNKVFSEFNPELFKRYINKTRETGKKKALLVLLNETITDNNAEELKNAIDDFFISYGIKQHETDNDTYIISYIEKLYNTSIKLSKHSAQSYLRLLRKTGKKPDVHVLDYITLQFDLTL